VLRTTVLLLSVDEGALLRHSLPAAIAQHGADVVVVDNASRDDTAAVAADHGVRHLGLAVRRSYAGAINAALAQTGGDAVLLLNADCFLAPGFLAAARPRLAESGVGSVAVKLLRVAGPPPPALGEVDACGMSLDRRRKNGLVGHGAAPATYARAGEAFGADGAAALYRRETLEQCAYAEEVLDEDMAMWATDADLAWRARTLGWRCVFEPEAIGHHIRSYSPSTRAAMPEAARRQQFRNRLLMIAKNETWAGVRRDGAWIAAYEVLALGHALLRERELLGGYVEAARLLGGALARRRELAARRRVARPPFGLEPRP